MMEKQNLSSFRDSLPDGNGARAKFDRLNPYIQLRGIGHWGTGLKKNSTIKKMLGISSKRFMRSGEVAHYARNVKRINNVARTLSSGTAIGVALDIAAGAMEIGEACSTGREQQCTKAKFVEVGKMMVGIPTSVTIGGIGAKAAVSMCFRMAGPSRGASLVVCGIAGGAAGGWLGGAGGSKVGEHIGNWLYELVDDE